MVIVGLVVSKRNRYRRMNPLHWRIIYTALRKGLAWPDLVLATAHL